MDTSWSQPPRRIKALKERSVEDLEEMAQRLLPIPEWQRRYFPDFCTVADWRRDRRRGKLVHDLPPPWDLQFIVLYRLAQLIARKNRHDARCDRRKFLADRKEQGWEITKELREHAKGRYPATRADDGEAIGRILRGWGVSGRAPSPKTLNRYRHRHYPNQTIDRILELVSSSI